MLSLPVSNILHKVGYSNIYTAVIRLGRSVLDPLRTYGPPPVYIDSYLLLESGERLLLENGSFITLETN